MKNAIVFLFALMFCGFQAGAQVKISWEMLKNVTFTEEYDPDYGAVFKYPTFSKEVQALNGKEVYIRGYLVPIDIEAGMFALSLHPYTSCFFCGKAGPETVIELEIGSKNRYMGLKMDQILTFRGKFKTNRDDVLKLIYILEDAEIYYGK
jgi:hypothetical protein